MEYLYSLAKKSDVKNEEKKEKVEKKLHK